jgi:putative component of membrane protein insertase Oxa1/YidC/SpoIIIJ protein YidD
MPTRWEQDVAETYVNEHTLNRPKNIIKNVVLFSLVFFAVTGCITWLICSLVNQVGISLLLSQSMCKFTTEHPILSEFLTYLTVCIVTFCACSKIIFIGGIRIYQHYAPDEIRRRCLFKPTCSEYAILAVQQYGVVIGLCKSVCRLMRRCKGNVYKIDYP